MAGDQRPGVHAKPPCCCRAHRCPSDDPGVDCCCRANRYLEGKEKTEAVSGYLQSGRTAYDVYMPAASAALVVIKPR
jgi:hypothetical protein